MKKHITVLLFAALAFCAKAQDTIDVTTDAERIIYWVGSGSDSAVMAVNWHTPDTCLAWGIRFNGSISPYAALDTIQLYDPRFWWEGTGYVSDIHFVTSSGDTLGLAEPTPPNTYNFWWININGYSPNNLIISNGDFAKWGDAEGGVGYQYYGGYYMQYAWHTPITPVPAPEDDHPNDATIDASQITYWVGTGSNSAVMAVNWNNPDTCLAWGVRFNGEILSTDALDTIQLYDPRFSWDTMNGGFVGDIFFITSTNDTLKLSSSASGYNFWWLNINGRSANDLTLHNGDFAKYGDAEAAIPYNYVDYGGGAVYPSEYAWTKTVTPVPAPAHQGINTASQNTFRVWPNPASSQIHVALHESTTIELYDLTGRCILSQPCNGQSTTTLNVSALRPGLYIVKAGSEAMKVVVR